MTTGIDIGTAANPLWGGRFNVGASSLLSEINASVHFDYRLAEQDIAGSIAHVSMLAAQNIIPVHEAELIQLGLKEIWEDILSGVFAFEPALVIPLYWALSVRHALAGAADAAALAAADTASGLIAGYPCSNAERLAVANDARIEECAVDGRIVTVTASRRILGILVTTSATAGPPPTGAD